MKFLQIFYEDRDYDIFCYINLLDILLILYIKFYPIKNFSKKMIKFEIF